jgi:hypothetical protein
MRRFGGNPARPFRIYMSEPLPLAMSLLGTKLTSCDVRFSSGYEAEADMPNLRTTSVDRPAPDIAPTVARPAPSEALNEGGAGFGQLIGRFQRREVANAFEDPEGRLRKKRAKVLRSSGSCST